LQDLDEAAGYLVEFVNLQLTDFTNRCGVHGSASISSVADHSADTTGYSPMFGAATVTIVTLDTFVAHWLLKWSASVLALEPIVQVRENKG
jgi:hypothetical protein